MEPDYKFSNGNREVWCYGEIEPDSNFELVHTTEYMDGTACDVDGEVYNTWHKVMGYLKDNYKNFRFLAQVVAV